MYGFLVMNETFGEHMALSFQRLLPLLVSILLVLLPFIPINVLFFENIKPAISLICIYFWLLHRPDLFNIVSVAILALFEDVLSAAPFGSNLFSLLLAYVIVTNLAKYFNAKPFVVIWYGFGALAFVVLFAKWFVVSIYYGQFLPLQNLVFCYLLTVAVYPIFSIFNVFIQNTFIKDDE